MLLREHAGTGQPTVFAYDADGQRVMTTYPDGTIVYTPFPDYELTDPPGSGANTARTTYRLGGQIVAVQTKVNSTVTIYYTYTDHLGNVSALSWLAVTFITPIPTTNSNDFLVSLPVLGDDKQPRPPGLTTPLPPAGGT